ncbi:MAG: C4-type zinc ribbon domain-containing protein [Chloroflexota bacterium]
MNVAKQLYELQEVDLEIESTRQAINQTTGRLGESEEIARARNALKTQREEVNNLAHRQHGQEWEIDDLNSKITAADEKLYSGRIHNPKELSDLQQETEILKTKRAKLEDELLALMEGIEHGNNTVANMERELQALEATWHEQQEKLGAELDDLKADMADLEERQQSLTATIDPGTIAIYRELRQQKSTAVARVEQGICRGCRISLSTLELQRAKSNELVRCSSCGRILYTA